MPRALIDPLYDRLRQAYPADHAYDAEDWAAGPMPTALRHFLDQVLNHRRQVEVRRLRNARSAWVDYDAADVQTAAEAFEDAVQAHVRVPADEWDAILRQAARVVTTYLVRPVPTLITFVFDDEDRALSLDRVRWRMQFLGPYTHLHDAVDTYAEQQSLSRLHPNALSSFLARVDARATSGGDPERWIDLLDPMYDVARTALDREAVPTDILKRFFEEKRASEIAQRLDDRARAGHTHTDRNALRSLLTSHRAPAPRSSPDPTAPATQDDAADEASDSDSAPANTPSDAEPETASEPEFLANVSPPAADDEDASRSEASSPNESRADAPPADPSPPDAPSANAPSPQAKASPPETTDDSSSSAPPDPTSAHESSSPAAPDEETATPRWQQFQHSAPSRAESSEADEPDEHTPLWARFKPSTSRNAEGEPSAASPPSSPIGSIDERTEALEREIFGTSPPSHRTAYVRQLFQGSTDDYRRTLDRIRNANNWSEASDVIARDVFRANQVNIYSDVAVHFTNAVETHFDA
jgi:hypothetical protein